MEREVGVYETPNGVITLLEKLGTKVYLAQLKAWNDQSNMEEESYIFVVVLQRILNKKILEGNKITKDKWNEQIKKFSGSQNALEVLKFLHDKYDTTYIFTIAPTQHPHYTLHKFMFRSKIKKTSIGDILNIILRVSVAVKEFVANRIACFNISPENVFVLGKENSSLLIQLSFFEIDHCINLPDLQVNVLAFESYQYHMYMNTNTLTGKAKENETEKYESKQCIEQRAVWQLAALLDYYLRGNAYFNIEKEQDKRSVMMEKALSYQYNLPERLQNEICGNQLQNLLLCCLDINTGKRYPFQSFQNTLNNILEQIILQRKDEQKEIIQPQLSSTNESPLSKKIVEVDQQTQQNTRIDQQNRLEIQNNRSLENSIQVSPEVIEDYLSASMCEGVFISRIKQLINTEEIGKQSKSSQRENEKLIAELSQKVVEQDSTIKVLEQRYDEVVAKSQAKIQELQDEIIMKNEESKLLKLEIQNLKKQQEDNQKQFQQNIQRWEHYTKNELTPFFQNQIQNLQQINSQLQADLQKLSKGPEELILLVTRKQLEVDKQIQFSANQGSRCGVEIVNYHSRRYVAKTFGDFNEFSHELRAYVNTHNLHHENILQIRGIYMKVSQGQSNAHAPEITPALLMDVADSNLQEYTVKNLWLSSKVASEAELPVARANPPLHQLDICIQLARGLQALHSVKMSHQDLKPQNVLIKNNKCMLMDFGAAKLGLEADRKTGLIGFTLYYSAPEQHESIGSLKSDIWSLGCIIFSLYTGLRPWFFIKTDKEFYKAIEEKRSIIEGISNPNFKAEVITRLRRGGVYEIIKQCLNYEHTMRPEAVEILGLLMNIKAQY